MDAFATDGQNGVVDVFGTPAQPTEQTVSHAETGPRRDSKADVSSRAPSSAGTSKMEHHRSTDGPRDVRPPSVAERPPSVVERPPSVNVRRPSETSTPLRPSSSAQPSPSASSEASEMSPSPVRYRPPSSTKLRPSLASQTPFRSLPNSPQKRPEKNADIFDILLGTSGQVAPSPAQPVSGVQPRSHFLRTLAERQARRAERAGSASSGSMNVSPNKPEAVSEKTVEAKG